MSSGSSPSTAYTNKSASVHGNSMQFHLYEQLVTGSMRENQSCWLQCSNTSLNDMLDQLFVWCRIQLPWKGFLLKARNWGGTQESINSFTPHAKYTSLREPWWPSDGDQGDDWNTQTFRGSHLKNSQWVHTCKSHCSMTKSPCWENACTCYTFPSLRSQSYNTLRISTYSVKKTASPVTFLIPSSFSTMFPSE